MCMRGSVSRINCPSAIRLLLERIVRFSVSRIRRIDAVDIRPIQPPAQINKAAAVAAEWEELRVEHDLLAANRAMPFCSGTIGGLSRTHDLSLEDALPFGAAAGFDSDLFVADLESDFDSDFAELSLDDLLSLALVSAGLESFDFDSPDLDSPDLDSPDLDSPDDSDFDSLPPLLPLSALALSLYFESR